VIAYLLMGMGIVTLVMTGVASCEHKGKLTAQREVAVKEATIKSMVATAEHQAKEAEARETQWRLANEALKTKGKRERAQLAAELERVRGNPSRPDGSAVQTASCPGTGVDGVPEKFVSLTEYESLQTRAAFDAQDWVRLQDYVTSVCLARGPSTPPGPGEKEEK
jgi:hypothetical protein